MGVRDRFDTIVTSLELRCRKPKERIFRTALERIGASAKETWFIGDSVEADYQGAQRVGMKPILIDPERSEPSPERVSHLFEIEGMLR